MKLAGGFKYFLCSPLTGEMIQFDQYILVLLRVVLMLVQFITPLMVNCRHETEQATHWIVNYAKEIL